MKRVFFYAREMRKHQTKSEERLWSFIRKRQILNLKFNRQFVIKHSEILRKENYYIADFYSHQKRIIIEVDGEIHNHQVTYDKIRDITLKELGYNVIHFKNKEVQENIEAVITKLKDFINSIKE